MGLCSVTVERAALKSCMQTLMINIYCQTQNQVTVTYFVGCIGQSSKSLSGLLFCYCQTCSLQILYMDTYGQHLSPTTKPGHCDPLSGIYRSNFKIIEWSFVLLQLDLQPSNLMQTPIPNTELGHFDLLSWLCSHCRLKVNCWHVLSYFDLQHFIFIVMFDNSHSSRHAYTL